MQSPRSDQHVRDEHTAVLIPLRSMERGKNRLGSALSDHERAELIRSMATTVVRAACGLDVIVVHDDPDVARWAEQLGATALAGDRPGLNNAVAQGLEHARSLGYERVIVAHADLPHAVDFRPLASIEGIAIVPDLVGDGTNVLSLPTDVAFDFAYGPDSFDHHRRNAEATGRPVQVIHDEALGFDVDHPEDLAILEHQPPEETP